MNRLDSFYFELEKAKNELKAIETMTEGEVCDMYNVDYKAEAMTLIDEDIVVLKSLIVDELDKINN